MISGASGAEEKKLGTRPKRLATSRWKAVRDSWIGWLRHHDSDAAFVVNVAVAAMQNERNVALAQTV
jgi:hypothetical protein